MEKIITALKKIQEKGSFCAKKMTSIEPLNLEIKPFGPVKFPLNPRDIKALIKLAKPAKFGFRDKTVLNKSVRDAWEISKNNIKIEKTNWNKMLSAVVELFRKDLGLPETLTLKADLHNLLIYEPGQFFDYHQDSEKLEGMATLIVVLPSLHKGGTLVIDHQGVKKQFQSSRFPVDKLTFIAFYADCHHKITEIKEGYRFALTYNLILENNAKKISIPREKKSYDTVTQSLCRYFIDQTNAKETSHQLESPKQCVYLLDHCYTQSGLSWDHLKNGDILRAEALKVAADALDLEICMALADVQETWDCEVDYDPYQYRRRKYFYDEYEDEDNEEEEKRNEDSVQVNDLIDSSTVLKHWIDRENKPLHYKEYAVSSDYIGWTKANNKFKPFQSDYEGYMGNYGNTLDRWYHRAAIILWQKKDHYPVLFEMDPYRVFSALFRLTKKKDQEAEISKILNSLLPYWSEYLQQNRTFKDCSTIFTLALYVKDPGLAQDLLIGFDMKALSPERAVLFLALRNTYGMSWCINILQAWTTSKDRWDTGSRCENIALIVKHWSSHQDHRTLTEWLLTYQLDKIKKENNNCVRLMEGIVERIKEIMDFIKACMIVNNHVVYVELLNHVIGHLELYPVLELVSIIYYLKKNLKSHDLNKWGYQRLFGYVLRELENEQKRGLRKIEDWSINEKSSCDCQDCDTLNEFLQSSTSKNLRWPLGKERRKHIHRIIEGLGIPVSHRTEHTGSPGKLMLTKTDKLYQQAKQRFHKVEKALSSLTENSDINVLEQNCIF